MEQHGWVEVLSFKLQKEFQEFLNTSFPAEIISVKDFKSKQFVDVKPLIHIEDEDGVILDTPIIYNVPITFPSAGGGLLSFPVAVTDTVLIVISQRDISQWLIGDGSPTASTDIDNFDITDAIAIPGLYTSNTNLKPSPTDVELKFAGSSVRLTPDGDIVASAPSTIDATAGSSATVTAPSITLNGNVTINGNTSIQGTLTNNGVNVGSDHQHSGVDTGSGITGSPT